MAKNVDCLCHFAVCAVIFAFLVLVPSTDSTNNGDLHVRYSVAGISRDIHTAVHSLEDVHLLRVKRQQPDVVNASAPQSPSNTSTVSSNSSSTSAANTTAVNVSAPATITTTPPQAPQTTTQRGTTQRPTQGSTTVRPTPSSATTHKLKTTTTKTPNPPQQTTKPPTPHTNGQQAPTNDDSTAKPPGPTTPQPKLLHDNHNYYTSTILPDSVDEHFIELVNPNSQDTLNSGHRLAVTVILPFKFRFYGHNITNVTIATGGFIYMSPFLHQWLTATQYIAPLMANFDTSTSPDSNIFYKQVGEEFIIEWHNVILKDQDAHGSFIFQTKLKSDGTITFIYKTLPLPVQNISSTNHPVKIGLSDAFYNDTFLPQYGIKRRTIIEYHRVAFLKEQIEEGTVIILRPLPTCNMISDCGACTQHTNVKFDCKWCDRVSRCSDGLDWYRQDWEKNGCKSAAFDGNIQCNSSTTASISTAAVPTPVPNRNTNSRVSPTTTMTTKLTTSRQTNKNSIKTTQSIIVHSTHNEISTKGIILTATTPATIIQSNLARTSVSVSQTRAGVDASKDDCSNSNDAACKSGNKGSVAAAVAVVLVLVVLLGGMALWGFYAYTHPTSPSGIWLMEHRPSQMKAKLTNMKFWKRNTPGGTKYAVESEA